MGSLVKELLEHIIIGHAADGAERVGAVVSSEDVADTQDGGEGTDVEVDGGGRGTWR